MNPHDLTARAVYFRGDGTVDLRSEAVEVGTDEVLLQSRLIGISHGSERRVLSGRLPSSSEGETIAALRAAETYPVKYGYMNVGEGSDGGRYFAFYPHQDLFPYSPLDLIPLADDLSDEDAVLLPSVETAVNVVHDLHPRLGETVAVAGQGVIGLLVGEILVAAGVSVLALDPVPSRRSRSEGLGCRPVDPVDPDAREKIRDMTEGRGLDGSVNLSGDEEGLQLLIDSAAMESTVVEASWFGSAMVNLSLGTAFHRRKIRLVSSQVSRIPSVLSPRWSKERRFALAMELAKRLRPSKYVTHRIPLSAAADAFELLARGGEETLQILLDPREG